MTVGEVTQMRREIGEQPGVIARTLDALLPRADELRELARGRRRLLFAARGSSDNAAVYGRYLCEVHAGWPGGLASPSVATHYRRRLNLDDTVAVCISQSGATDELVETAAWARDCGARTVAVTNTAGSPLAELADLALETPAGRELAVPATKTYTAQLVALAVLGLALGPDDARLASDLRRAPDEAAALLDTAGAARAAAQAVADCAPIVVSGRGFTLATAQELSLKLLEACYRPSLGLSRADLVHGPIAVVGPGAGALVAAPADGPMLPSLTALAATLRDRGATVVGIGGDAGFAAACDHALRGPDLPEPLAPIALTIPGQLLVEALARHLGLDPDAPRGLRKVTQTNPGGSDRRLL